MAIVTDLMQSYDQATNADIWVAEGVHMISPTNTPLQLLLPKIQVAEVKAEWIEDDLAGQVTTLAVTLASDTASVAVTLAAGAIAAMIPDDVATYNTLIRIDQEVMLITAISGNVATVTRAHAGTLSTHSVSAPVHIISQLELEGADGKKASGRARTRPSNYVQTFSRTVEVSGVQEEIRKLGGVTSEIDYQLMQAMRQLALELEKTLIMGVASAVGSVSTFRTMAGLWAMITTNRVSDSGAVGTSDIETDIRTIWDAGGNPRAIVTTGKLAQEIANLYEARIMTDINTQIGGVNITSVVNPLGEGPIAIIPHRLVADGEYYMLDTSRMGLAYIRPFFMKPLANDGDADKRWIGGDYTLELMNEAAHVYHYGLTG